MWSQDRKVFACLLYEFKPHEVPIVRSCAFEMVMIKVISQSKPARKYFGASNAIDVFSFRPCLK